MLNIFAITSIDQNRPSGKKTHKKRFGIIPAEPCRASSMQSVWQTPGNHQVEELTK